MDELIDEGFFQTRYLALACPLYSRHLAEREGSLSLALTPPTTSLCAVPSSQYLALTPTLMRSTELIAQGLFQSANTDRQGVCGTRNART
eukprot:201651-Rhodomonas_salina.1